MALSRKMLPLNNGGVRLPKWTDDDFMKDLPEFTSFLMDEQYVSGERRVTGSISFFVQEGVLKAAVNDKDRNAVAFISAQGFYELLQLINDGIKDDSLEWKLSFKTAPGKTPPF